MVKIEIDGEIITATLEHPFYANGDWKAAGLLETGDNILLFSGKLAKVKEVKYEGAHAPVSVIDANFEETQLIEENSVKVFNFKVEGWHTYFVGWLRVLVHNAGICLKKLSSRLKYLGRTPGKNSKTGKEVFERMAKEVPPKARLEDEFGNAVKEFWDASSNKWRDIKQADMGHIDDAVSWWNSTGRKHGAKSKEVREWMLDSDNYALEYFKTNRSNGAKLTEQYLPPL